MKKSFIFTHVEKENSVIFPKTKNVVGLYVFFPSQDVFWYKKNSHKGLTSGQWFAMFWQTLTQAVWVREKETERGTVREEHHTHTQKNLMK